MTGAAGFFRRGMANTTLAASYEPSVAEGFGNLPSSPLYLSPAFLKAEPSSMYFRC